MLFDVMVRNIKWYSEALRYLSFKPCIATNTFLTRWIFAEVTLCSSETQMIRFYIFK